MTRLLTPHIATMTELREPHKVLARADGEATAILKSSEVVAYLIPAKLAHPEWADPTHPGYGSFDELFAALNARSDGAP
jgi:antitoxin StbD